MAAYKYTECGLDNVLIHNMDVVVDDAGDEVYELPNVVGLHKLIAHCIVTSPSGVTPKELRFLRTEMGLTQGQLAQLVKKEQLTIGRWERGETAIDANAEFVIRILAMEKLGLNDQVSAEEMAKSCVPSAEFRMIRIDGSDPENYRPLAA